MRRGRARDAGGASGDARSRRDRRRSGRRLDRRDGAGGAPGSCLAYDGTGARLRSSPIALGACLDPARAASRRGHDDDRDGRRGKRRRAKPPVRSAIGSERSASRSTTRTPTARCVGGGRARTRTASIRVASRRSIRVRRAAWPWCRTGSRARGCARGVSERATDERVGAPVMRRRPRDGRIIAAVGADVALRFFFQIDELVARVQRRRLGDNCPARSRSGQWTSRPRRPPRRTKPRPASRRAPAPRSPSSSDTGSASPPVPLPQGLRRRDVFVVGRLLRRRGRAARAASPARLAARSRRAACARSRSRSIVLASSASGTDTS